MDIRNFKHSSNLEPTLYRMMINEKKAEVERIIESKDVTSYNNSRYYFGLCDFEIQSTSIKFQCPFDIRSFKNYSAEECCINWCRLDLYRRSNNITDMSDIPLYRRKDVARIIKHTLMDFTIKV